jgi:hypothetical protein
MLKEELRRLVAAGSLDQIETLTGQQRRVLSFLTALTFDPDPLVCWRAVEAIGRAAARLADTDPEYVRVHLRRMQWLLNDESGGIGWRLPEAMGEIIRCRPHIFAEFVPIVMALFDMEEEDVAKFRPGILWAVGRLAQVFPAEVLEPALEWITPCLGSTDAATRGMAAWCLGQMQRADLLAGHPALLTDPHPLDFYHHGQINQKTVAQLAQEAMEQ